ncbi:hypothetical protein [Xanthomonas phage SB1]|uniref:dATP/dGTP diphosphohydrolase N-terminal domain-containing protein n=1 Tax=Xanthomonas phage SB1 TaxID=3117471 RepID=A0ABZ2GUF4_9CAUD
MNQPAHAKAYRVGLVTAEDVGNGVVKDSLVYLHSQVPGSPDLFYFIPSPESEEGFPLRMNQVTREPAFDHVVPAYSDEAVPVNESVVLDVADLSAEVPQPTTPQGLGGGLKYDAGKPRPTLLMRGCAWALQGVSAVLAFGAAKYKEDSWREVENGVSRYSDALMRHLLAWLGGEENDEESGMPHLWHAATNIMFLIELTRNKENA